MAEQVQPLLHQGSELSAEMRMSFRSMKVMLKHTARSVSRAGYRGSVVIRYMIIMTELNHLVHVRLTDTVDSN